MNSSKKILELISSFVEKGILTTEIRLKNIGFEQNRTPIAESRETVSTVKSPWTNAKSL